MMPDKDPKESPAELNDKTLDGVVGGSFDILPSKGSSILSGGKPGGATVGPIAGDLGGGSGGIVGTTKPPKGDPLFPGTK